MSAGTRNAALRVAVLAHGQLLLRERDAFLRQRGFVLRFLRYFTGEAHILLYLYAHIGKPRVRRKNPALRRRDIAVYFSAGKNRYGQRSADAAGGQRTGIRLITGKSVICHG